MLFTSSADRRWCLLWCRTLSVGEAATARHHLRGCLTSLSLLNLCVCSVCEWSPAGLACFRLAGGFSKPLCGLCHPGCGGACVRCLCPKRLGEWGWGWGATTVCGLEGSVWFGHAAERLGGWNLSIPSCHWQSVGMWSASSHLLPYK